MKKLIPALCMLLIAAALLGTSTYAWFSMNATVTAEGMEVTAKSNAGFLLINSTGEKAKGTTSEAAKYETGGTSSSDRATYPVAYYATSGTLNNQTTEAGKWYTTSSNKQGVAVSGDEKNKISKIEEGTAIYMVTYKVWLTLSADSEPIGDKLIQVTFSLASGGDVATSAVVLIGDAGAHGKFALNSTNKTGTTAAVVPLSKDATVPVTVYVYIDGNSTNVYSDYINGGKTIAGNVSLQFDLIDNPNP